MNDNQARRVLLPIDGSAHAERAAKYLSGCAGSLNLGAIYVLNVQSIEEQAALAAAGDGDAPDYEERGRSATASARAVLDTARLPNSMTTLLGEPAAVIVRAAEEEEVDEIVIGSRSKDHVGDIMGSVAYKVIHRARIPVTIVPTPRSDAQRGPPTDTVHRILLAVDGSEHAARAVRFVCRLQSASRAVEVQLLNVMPSIPQGYVRGLLSEEMLDNFRSDARQQALDAASTALQGAGLKFTVHIVPGDAAEKIVETASGLQCARIVMGTRGLSSVGGLVLGSVAYKVIHLASIPVTLVK
jgi:nucleotide-binding universal stress UspA family protein